ncbi:MAG TPA: PorP/SprF family type IX secretion system membrane protein [Niastella sp.]
MKRVILYALSVALTATSINKVRAQVDPHFTQYYIHTSWLNPALTGLFDGNYRVAGIYRNQWGNMGSPFSTMGASAETVTDKNINLGLHVINQKAGDGGYSYNTGYGNLNYTGVRFGAQQSQHIAMAIQMGFIQRKFNPSKLVFSDQWNPVTGTMRPTAETFNKTSSLKFDAGAGILYYDASPGKKANMFAGFSASHITQPENEFSASGTEKIPVRYTAHAGVRLLVNDMLMLTPNALFLSQGTAQEKMLGLYAQLRAAATTDVMLGMNYRFNDAIAAHAGFTWNNLVFSMSYDINTSDLGKMAGGANSFEISISYTGRKKVKTPEVEFVCPRL